MAAPCAGNAVATPFEEEGSLRAEGEEWGQWETACNGTTLDTQTRTTRATSCSTAHACASYHVHGDATSDRALSLCGGGALGGVHVCMAQGVAAKADGNAVPIYTAVQWRGAGPVHRVRSWGLSPPALPACALRSFGWPGGRVRLPLRSAPESCVGRERRDKK